VVTSGRGGVLPPGLPIGVVSAIGEDRIAVTPFVDWDRLEYVRLLQYSGVPAPEAPAELQAETPALPLPAKAPAGEPPAAEPSEAPGVPASAAGQVLDPSP
jgi:rod shape-determining protein MreC